MNKRTCWAALVVAAGAFVAGGCPQQPPLEFVAGGTGQTTRLSAVASVRVFSPAEDLSLRAGTPIDVNWQAVATTTFASVDVIFDRDQDPTNGNEIVAADNLPLTETSALLDTSDLEAGQVFVGVLLFERNELSTFAYAPGSLNVNQRTQFFFTSPRDIFEFDRSRRVTPRFDVAWEMLDPDSTVTVRVYLDPDQTPNGNELLLRESTNQTGDSFSFSISTALLEPGVYRILALVDDGVDQTAFYAPAQIRIRARLSDFIDLRELDNPQSTLRGAIFEGFNPRDNAGSFVSSAGDLDGDGFDDFLIVAQFGKPQYQINTERTGVGEAYLIYGRARDFTGRINLNSTGTLFRGEVFGGPPEVLAPVRPSRGITSFALLSDWDNDGLPEMAFGVPFTDSAPVGQISSEVGAPLDPVGYFRTGAVVVASSVCLRPDLGFPGRNIFNLAEFGTLAHVPLEPLTFPFCVEGITSNKAASAPGSGSFFHRHLVGVTGAPNEGSVRLGCRLSSDEFGDQFGETVSAGDFDSIIISAPNRDPGIATLSNFGLSIPGAGVISIYFVNTPGSFFPWTTTQAPPAGADWPGFPVEGNVDLLPHGGPYHYIVSDFRAPARISPFPFRSPGYVVEPTHTPPCVYLVDRDAPTAARTTQIWTSVEGARLGGAKSVADFNADGLRDILIGSPLAGDGRGAAFLVFGRLRELVMSGELRIDELGLPLNGPNDAQSRIFDGVRVVGAPGERLGQALDSAGDFNGDGVADVLIGSPLTNQRKGGAAVFFGSRDVINLTQEEIPFDELPERGLGVIFFGEEEGDLAGARVATAGDVDGDGNDDILIAAPNRSVRLDLDQDGVLEVDRTECGVVYLIYGSPDLKGRIALADVGTEKLPGAVFIGAHSGDHLGAGLGLQGDRSLGIAAAGDVDGDGFGDLLLGSVSASPRNRTAAGEAYLIYGEGQTPQ